MDYLLHSDLLSLNLEDYFPDSVDLYFKNYIQYLETQNVDSSIISNVRQFHKKIHMSIIEYYSGQHGAARAFFNDAMEYINVEELCSPIRENDFFRARSYSEEQKKSGHIFGKDDMFHIPMEKRYLVSTQRYSFPGMPCLYLGTSYEVCCTELGNWDIDLPIAKITRTTSTDVNILDLFFLDKYDISKINSEDWNKIYSLWPIIASCSFSYKEKNKMTFRPDYIIPQLLLEYIIDNNFDRKIRGITGDIIGIRYHSVQSPFFDIKEKKFDKNYVNYVFPILSDAKNGHCTTLKELFEVTDIFTLKELKS